MAMQESIFTRRGVDRILRYAFELARSRPKKHLTSATKSNGIFHTMPFWDGRVTAMAKAAQCSGFSVSPACADACFGVGAGSVTPGSGACATAAAGATVAAGFVGFAATCFFATACFFA
jgi:hypothetical protein